MGGLSACGLLLKVECIKMSLLQHTVASPDPERAEKD